MVTSPKNSLVYFVALVYLVELELLV